MTVHYRTFVNDGGGPDFVISDGGLDRHGTRINPDGWNIDDYRKNPVALWAHDNNFVIGSWENLRVEKGQLKGRLKFAADGTSNRIDELKRLFEQGHLRAVSPGFRVLREGTRGKTDYDFEQQLLLEASLVAVPSNPNALMAARSLNLSSETVSLVFGEHAETRQRDIPNGEHAEPRPHKRIFKVEQSLSKRIESAQNDLNTARDALTAHLQEPTADADQVDLLSDEIEQREEKLATLERAEKALAVRTVEQRPALVETPKRKPLGLSLKEASPEDHFIRAMVTHIRACGNREPLEQSLEKYSSYRDFEATQVMTRAAVAAATTFTAGWAQELVQTATADFLANLDPNAVFPRLSAAGKQLSFGPERGQIKIPSRASTPSTGGSFVAEGAPIPVRRLGLTTITLSPHKVGVISVFTREIVRYSNPQIESIVREAIRDDTAIILDGLLLDNVAGSTTRPAGLLNGVTPITPSAVATTYGRILADITALTAPFYAVNAGSRLVLLLNPAQALQLSMAPGPDGTFGWVNQFTSRFTVFESTTIPANKVVLVDAADFVSVLGAPEFDVSEHAAVHMEDTTPLPLVTGAQGSGVVASPSSSMFQEAKIALRMLLDTTWAMRRTGMVQTITTVNWAPS